MRVQLTTELAGRGFHWLEGEVIDFEPKEAARLIKTGQGVEAPEETAVLPKPSENAAKPAGRHRR